jgi:DNA-binding PadR family transcriptional regulator
MRICCKRWSGNRDFWVWESAVEPPRLSLTEYAVLGVLAEGPSHAFALSKQLGPSGPVGRVLAVRRSLVYRALDRLVAGGFAESVCVEKGGAGPQRVIHRMTGRGRRRLQGWLHKPVDHVRDLRIEFLLKLTLLVRAGNSPLALIRDQKAALGPVFAALHHPAAQGDDHLGLWRRHNAAAAAAYLDDLEATHRRS